MLAWLFIVVFHFSFIIVIGKLCDSPKNYLTGDTKCL